jgi:hypothetical protein
MDTLPQVFATGWASGVNAYATVLLLGIMQRLGVAGVPDGLGRVEVLAIAAVLFTVELVVDKVPYLDSSWDVVHTAIRPTVGTVLGVMIAGDSTDISELLGGSTGGSTALATHAVKAGFRLAVNVSPEPVTNFLVSTAEDITVVVMVVLSLATPWLAAALAAILLVIGLWVVFVLARYGRRFVRWRRSRSSRPLDAPPP